MKEMVCVGLGERRESPACGFQNQPMPSAVETCVSQTEGKSLEAARVTVLILTECLVNFSQGVDPSEIDNFLLYLYSSE